MYTSILIAERHPVAKRIVYDEANTDTPKPLRGVLDGTGYRAWRVLKVQHGNLGDLLVGKPRAEVREDRSSEEAGQRLWSEGSSVEKERMEWGVGKDVVEETHKWCGHLFGGVERECRPNIFRTCRRTSRETSSATTRESGTAITGPSTEGSSTRGAGCGKSARPVLMGGGRALRGRPALPTKVKSRMYASILPIER